MKRAEKKKHKRKFKRIIALIISILVVLVSISGYILYPYILSKFTGEKEVQSAFVKRSTIKDLEYELQQKGINYSQIEFANEGESYIVTLQSSEVVKLSRINDLEEQVSTLHRLLRRLTIENRMAKEIDLRFSRPVVKF